ncbi:uncharacterized protein LOC123312736 [Coccinella septempunctata]|uniref:uncharacterized protein LOC123312736 n=1 Tax=Coccinella septempunctata TaxID=41139 RepID=UPI001D0818E7|nr:uncharacterized protein LOC123312736 [Coccinella septempunctata]
MIHPSVFLLSAILMIVSVWSSRVLEIENPKCCGREYQSLYRIYDNKGTTNFQAVIQKGEKFHLNRIGKSAVPINKVDKQGVYIRELIENILPTIINGSIQRGKSLRSDLEAFATAVSEIVRTEFDDIFYGFSSTPTLQHSSVHIIKAKNYTLKRINIEVENVLIKIEEIVKALNGTHKKLKNNYRKCLMKNGCLDEHSSFFHEFFNIMSRLKMSFEDWNTLERKTKENISMYLSNFRKKLNNSITKLTNEQRTRTQFSIQKEVNN